MLKTFVQERQSGKTTKVIGLMENDENLLLIVPNQSMKQFYPKEMEFRIETIESVLNGNLRGRTFNKVVIDEGFLFDKEKLAQLYYYLGRNQIYTIAYGTI